MGSWAHGGWRSTFDPSIPGFIMSVVHQYLEMPKRGEVDAAEAGAFSRVRQPERSHGEWRGWGVRPQLGMALCQRFGHVSNQGLSASEDCSDGDRDSGVQRFDTKSDGAVGLDINEAGNCLANVAASCSMIFQIKSNVLLFASASPVQSLGACCSCS